MKLGLCICLTSVVLCVSLAERSESNAIKISGGKVKLNPVQRTGKTNANKQSADKKKSVKQSSGKSDISKYNAAKSDGKNVTTKTDNNIQANSTALNATLTNNATSANVTTAANKTTANVTTATNQTTSSDTKQASNKDKKSNQKSSDTEDETEDEENSDNNETPEEGDDEENETEGSEGSDGETVNDEAPQSADTPHRTIPVSRRKPKLGAKRNQRVIDSKTEKGARLGPLGTLVQRLLGGQRVTGQRVVGQQKNLRRNGVRTRVANNGARQNIARQRQNVGLRVANNKGSKTVILVNRQNGRGRQRNPGTTGSPSYYDDIGNSTDLFLGRKGTSQGKDDDEQDDPGNYDEDEA